MLPSVAVMVASLSQTVEVCGGGVDLAFGVDRDIRHELGGFDRGVVVGGDDRGDDLLAVRQDDVVAGLELGVDDGRRDGVDVDIAGGRHDVAARSGADGAFTIIKGDVAVRRGDADVAGGGRQGGRAVRDVGARQVDVAVGGDRGLDGEVAFRVQRDIAAESGDVVIDRQVLLRLGGDIAGLGGDEAEFDGVAADQDIAARDDVLGGRDVALRAQRDVAVGDERGVGGVEDDVFEGVGGEAGDGDASVHVDIVGLQDEVVRAADSVGVFGAEDDVAAVGEDVDVVLQGGGAVDGHAVRVDVAVQFGVAFDDQLLGFAGSDRHVVQADVGGGQRGLAVLREHGRQRADEVDLLRAGHVAAEHQLVGHDLDLGVLGRRRDVVLEEDLVAGHADRVVRRVGRDVRVGFRGGQGVLEQGLGDGRHVDEADFHVAAEFRDVAADEDVEAAVLRDVVGEADRVVRRGGQGAVAGHRAVELDVDLVGRDGGVAVDDDLAAREGDAAGDDRLVAEDDVAVGRDVQHAGHAAGQHVHVVGFHDVGHALDAVDGQVGDRRLERRVR